MSDLKSRIAEHGAELADRQAKFYDDPAMGAGVTCGFQACLDLLWPLSETLKYIEGSPSADSRFMSEQAAKALADLESKLESK